MTKLGMYGHYSGGFVRINYRGQGNLYAGAILLYDCPMMDSWPAEIKFSKTWRTYQARVLSELAHHLDDNHLHIIAAPGSGKTVLGLEVARRLDRPTLLFSPTLAISTT